MNNTERLAKEFRSRDNPHYIGTVIATVKLLSPLTIEIPMPIGRPLVINKRIKVASRLCPGDQRKTIIATTSAAGDPLHRHADNETTITTTEHLLNIGDRVIVAAAENASLYFIIDKVGDW